MLPRNAPKGACMSTERFVPVTRPVDHPVTRPAIRPAGDPIVITVVHAPACHLCDDAENLLAGLAEKFPRIAVERIDVDSAAGRRLIAEHRPAMNPLVLIDGEFFSSGRLSRGRLRTLLKRRMAGTAQL